MAAKKSTAKKAAAKAEDSRPESAEAEATPTTEMDGEEYANGYMGVAVDDEDYSVAAQVAKLAAGE